MPEGHQCTCPTSDEDLQAYHVQKFNADPLLVGKYVHVEDHAVGRMGLGFALEVHDFHQSHFSCEDYKHYLEQVYEALLERARDIVHVGGNATIGKLTTEQELDGDQMNLAFRVCIS